MYPYHNRCIQRIRNGELVGIEDGTGEYAVVLIFSTPPYRRPIKAYSLYRYEKVFADMGWTLEKQSNS